MIWGQEVEVGQVWRSRDKRDYGKTVTVEEVDTLARNYANGFVVVRSARRSRMRITTLRSRYELVKAAS